MSIDPTLPPVKGFVFSTPTPSSYQNEEPVVGRKFDQDKADWTLMPWRALKIVCRVLAKGALKYAPNNWKYVEGRDKRYRAAALRHVIDDCIAFQEEDEVGLLDPETQIEHLAHAVCCLLFLLHDVQKKKEALLSEKTA